MKIEIEVDDYSASSGIRLRWEPNAEILVSHDPAEMTTTITANRDGLRSLAQHLLVLSLDNVPEGTHVHLDDMNGLEDDSIGLIMERHD